MKIELKRRVDGKWQYIDVKEIAGVPLIDIISREAMTPESCMKITNDGRVTIVTDDMLHHTYYASRMYRMMCWRDALALLEKHYGDALLNSVPEYVAEVFPEASFIGSDNSLREAV